jgi:ubiquinone biosynthesis UbiH/UbiF/VisC/COQ6 family hydroxylase
MSSIKVTDKVDIAIIGDGLTGLCLALLLAQKQSDWNILVLKSPRVVSETKADNHAEFGHRKIALSESSRLILSKTELWSEISALSTAITQIHISDQGHIGHSKLIAEEQGLGAYGYVIDAEVFANILSKATAGLANFQLLTTVENPTLKPVSKGMSIVMEGSSVHADLVILANGEAPQQARDLGISFATKDYQRCALTAELTLAEHHHGVAFERFARAGPIALLPLPDENNQTRAGLVWTVLPERAEQLMAADENRFIEYVYNCFGRRAGAVVSVEKRRIVPLEQFLALEQVRSNLVLMGSAAHSLHPVAGQGFNLTLRDIAALVDLLSNAVQSGMRPGDLGTLQLYEDSRSADQKKVIGFSDALPELFTSTNPLLSVGRNMGLLGLDLAPGLRNAVAQFGAGLAGGEAYPHA